MQRKAHTNPQVTTVVKIAVCKDAGRGGVVKIAVCKDAGRGGVVKIAV